jgi:hypothetical protein
MSDILETIMDTENELLSHRYSVRKIYESMLEESLLSSFSFRRYDYYETILKPASSLHDEELSAFLLLRRPLTLPQTEKIFKMKTMSLLERRD